jgi:hypothetical protein
MIVHQQAEIARNADDHSLAICSGRATYQHRDRDQEIVPIEAAARLRTRPSKDNQS